MQHPGELQQQRSLQLHRGNIMLGTNTWIKDSGCIISISQQQQHPLNMSKAGASVCFLQHLSNLLAAPVMEVTAAALQVFQVLMRKTHHTSVRLAVSAGLTQRLLSLCKGWGGKEEVGVAAACSRRTVLHSKQKCHCEQYCQPRYAFQQQHWDN
eukprot:GHUV01041183.1.p2 GENE.GHUV01041183.1~~GHUV01041183.1.p2  ORF type:complete len:154 (-),score=39.09 GHUV01041183.1:1108-1569(-)